MKGRREGGEGRGKRKNEEKKIKENKYEPYFSFFNPKNSFWEFLSKWKKKKNHIHCHIRNRFKNGCLRSYPGESTRSHLHSEVKHLWAGLVEWWVTTFESPVLKTLFFFYFLFF